MKTKNTIEKNLDNFPLGFIGPDLDNKTIKTSSNWEKKWTRIIDFSASSLSKFVSGGNKVNFHKVFQEFSFASKDYLIGDIRNAKRGDKINIFNNLSVLTLNLVLFVLLISSTCLSIESLPIII